MSFVASYQLTEDLGRRRLVSKEAELVLDERVVDDHDVLGGHAHLPVV
jgi:hypothetical protein